MKLSFKVFPAMLLMLAFLSSCSTVKVLQTNAAEGFSLEDYLSYNYFEIELDTIDVPEFHERIKWIEQELRGQFEARGVTRTKDNPELLVNIGLVFDEKVQTRDTDIVTDAPRYAGNMNYSWESETVEMGSYLESTFVMHIVDAKSKVLLYETISQGVVVKSDAQSQKNIAASVKKMFSGL
jgi:hypothetical protein